MTERIKGHEDVILRLNNILKRKKLGHAYLFIGKEGIGKKSTALWFAERILSLGIKDEVKEKLKSRISKQIHPDLLVVVPKDGLISISQIREAEKWLFTSPMEGERKVLIIDDAHLMGLAAANAFLKTLEEPPESGVIILISSYHHQLPATIISRCQIVRFSPLKKETVKEILKEKGIAFEEALSSFDFLLDSISLALETRDPNYRELFSFAKKLYEGLCTHELLRVAAWKKDKESVKKLLSILRLFMREDMLNKKDDLAFWKRHLTLASLEEALYQYNIDPRLIVEYLELTWKEDLIKE